LVLLYHKSLTKFFDQTDGLLFAIQAECSWGVKEVIQKYHKWHIVPIARKGIIGLK